MENGLSVFTIFLNLPLVALVMARLTGLVAFVPFFSSSGIPVKARVLLAAGMTVIVLPFAAVGVTVPSDLGGLAVTVISELMIGLVFGFGLLTIFAGLQLAGRLIGQQMGLALANVFDPLSNEQTSILGQLYFWLAMVIFLVIGGHLAVISAVIGSFDTVPIGTFSITSRVIAMLCAILQTAYVVALKVCAPVIVTIFLTSLAMGFLARTVPQMNILSIGFALRSVLGFVLTIICLVAAMDVFVNVLGEVFYDLLRLLRF